jgi:hypothetical protein
MPSNDFEAMQICENGHVVTATAQGTSNQKPEFCPVCGAKALTACPACQGPIGVKVQPLQRITGVLGLTEQERPRHCAKCGKAFPWQEQAVAFLKDIGRECSLSKEELAQFDRAVDDVAQNNLRAPRSASKILAVAATLGNSGLAEASKLVREIGAKDVRDSLGCMD